MENPFSLIPVSWNNEELMARPVSWDNDPNTDETAVAIQYEITCPSCGCMVQFNAELEEIMCGECDSTANNPIFVSDDDLASLDVNNPVEGIEDQIDPDNPFEAVDPYEDPDGPWDGTYGLGIDVDDE
jgi:hypothetical protein